MRKQFKSIVKALYKFDLLSDLRLSNGLIKGQYHNYIIMFQWVTGKPYGCFEIYHISTVQVYDYTYESSYSIKDYFDRKQVVCVHSQFTDNPRYVNRILRNLIFGELD